ncbi:TetR/AcrR family transcriptional regulator [Nocardioides sp. BYT-33-1]|uniref:TetR/AcrR family transcriptional regulator n=1 Tax=Nocardioides sp. BYT-33-1 TaxID=3416952 RepID=UPI003F53BD03
MSTPKASGTARRRRLPRGALTPERIVTASLALLDEQGLAAFTMPRLGRTLGADQTAVYRHFASKDDLVLAVADRLLTEAFEDFEPAVDDWRGTLVDVCQRVRTTYVSHPAAAVLSGPRITTGSSEMKAADAVVGALRAAGIPDRELALYYRVIADFALLWSGGLAGFRILDKSIQEAERTTWTTAYATAPDQFGNLHSISGDLDRIESEQVFDTALELLLDSIAARAARARTERGTA